ncbi:VOC family protein [Paracoccus contaminans]|uniref:Glyoxalase n=1 Tax=Paracoccus contaminans TaxID=1945662 RepID=A0A1W6D048_9RHOB|nr:VOC family protein [Paracoccus contaminans]ARJ70435.1 glyoxalase [Paracoccus contaminans]
MLDSVSPHDRVARLASSKGRLTLGTGTVPLLDLLGDPALAPGDRRQAGLFHTAFLMPSRAELGRWLAHAAAMRVPLQGASDHIVSEAIYLADPEGNGIEVYADRPVARWHGPAGEIRMSTDPLDMQALLRAADGTEWSGFPQGGTIGHVHLQVGDTAEADRFYSAVLGLDIAARYTGASFYGSGGYHHQLAGNIWNSPRAERRAEGAAGLGAIEIILREAADLRAIADRAQGAGIAISKGDDGLTIRDPWNTAIILRA